MAKLSNHERGLGFTHVFRIDIEDYNETSGNADQTVTLMTSTGAADTIYVRTVALTTKGIIGFGGNILTVKVGTAGDDDGFHLSTGLSDITDGDLPGTINGGAFFNDGTTENTVSGYMLAGGSMIATLSLDAGDWSDNDGGEVLVLVDAIEVKDFV